MRFLSLSVIFAYLAVACSESRGSAGHVEVDTLESGAVLVSNAMAGLWQPSEAWRAIEETRIGSVDGADTTRVFGSVWDVTVDAYDRIYVLDTQSYSIRVFEWTGEYVRTLGRQGGGPGELSRPIALDWGPEGNLWVVDQRNARYTVFDTAGSYVTSYRRTIGGWGYGWGGGFDHHGNLYEPSYYADRTSGESKQVYIRHTVAEGVVAKDTFDLPVDTRESSYVMERADGSTWVDIPFAPRLTWRFDHRESLWFSTGETYRLYHLSLAGDTLRVVELEYVSVPVTERDLDGVREGYAEYGEQHVNRILDRTPNVKPAIRSLVVDDQGYVWVFRTEDSEAAHTVGAMLDVFDPEGRYLGAVTADISSEPAPEIIGDRMVGVAFGELDVGYIVAYRIEGRTGR